jgi:polysaccharide export outer membrane protein
MFAAFCMLTVWSGAGNADQSSAAYLLSPGDVVMVSVWQEDSLRQRSHRTSRWQYHLPLGRAHQCCRAGCDGGGKAGRCRLEKFLPDPNVSVVVKSIAGNMVYVQGKVIKPGPVQMAGPTPCLQALSMSGGLDKFADESEIVVHGTATKDPARAI